MLELICHCGASLKMIVDNVYIAEKWIEYHQHCYHKGDLHLFSDNINAVADKKISEHVNIFTGEQLEL